MPAHDNLRSLDSGRYWSVAILLTMAQAVAVPVSGQSHDRDVTIDTRPASAPRDGISRSGARPGSSRIRRRDPSHSHRQPRPAAGLHRGATSTRETADARRPFRRSGVVPATLLQVDSDDGADEEMFNELEAEADDSSTKEGTDIGQPQPMPSGLPGIPTPSPVPPTTASTEPIPADIAAGQPGMVRLNFGEAIELKGLVEIVIQRLGVNIIYEADVLKKQINIRAPQEIPVESLLPLLQSVLRMHQLSLQDAELPGWKRIVPAVIGGTGGVPPRSGLPPVAPLREPDQDLPATRSGMAITQTFALQRADPDDVNVAIKPFLSGAGANSLSVPDQRLLIVTDYAANLQRIGRLIELIDRQRPSTRIEFLTIEHASVSDLSAQLEKLIEARQSAQESGGPEGASGDVKGRISADERTNQLIIVGTENEIREIKGLARALDVPVHLTTKAYPMKSASATRVADLIRELLEQEVAGPRCTIAVDADGNKVLVTTTDRIHTRIDGLIQKIDVTPPNSQSPVRFYKLENVTAYEMLQTLQSLQGFQDGGAGFGSGFGYGDYSGVRGVRGGTRSPFFPGSNQPVGPGMQSPFLPGPNRPPVPGQYFSPPPSIRGTGGDTIRGQNQDEPSGADKREPQLGAARAQITADESSNTLIIVAEPEVQRVYAELIRNLDQRRPQVLIEARLVVIDTSDDFSLGVEISGGDREGDRRLFAFSSYGLSEVDPVDGALSILPGTGFNGTLVDPNVADVVLRALTRHRRARVLSSPRILVNDNALGVLTSVNEVPFASVNASNVVATTSFAGFAEAGTTIEVTPHISADDYLQLEYRITLNSFTGTGGDGIPPPRKTDEVASVVTIPDGHTVIVGGLNQRSGTDETQGIPLIEDIPILQHLGGRDTNMSSTSSLFVFLRPVVLRDDKFRNLRFLSERDADCAKTCSDLPRSEPLLMR